MKKFALLLPNLCGGGAERVSIDLAHEFAKQGHTVVFVLMSASGEFLPEVIEAFPVIDLKTRQTRSVPLTLARYLHQTKPDVLIANMWPLTTMAVAAHTLSRVNCRLLLVEHAVLSMQYASWGWLHNCWMRLSMMVSHRLAQHVAAVSAGAAADLATLAALPRHRVQVLYNPIPVQPSPPAAAIDAAEALWACNKGQRILTVGRFKPEKNHALLLKAFAQLAPANARLMLLGKGPEEQNLRALAQALGIQNRVIFAGFHADPSPFYATADLFVLSSDNEGFGNVLVEALSFGVPVVSTDCTAGPAEILENGRWGRLVPVGDCAALAQGMEQALVEPVDREALKRRACDFAPEIAAKRYLQLLGETNETGGD
jgi:glycosyltransferase involved in cell wall biosynthesis